MKINIGATVILISVFFLFPLDAFPTAHPIHIAKSKIGNAITTHIIPSASVAIKKIEKSNKLLRVPKIACFKSGSNPDEIPTAKGRKKKIAIPKLANPISVSIKPIVVNDSPTIKLTLNELLFLSILKVFYPILSCCSNFWQFDAIAEVVNKNSEMEVSTEVY